MNIHCIKCETNAKNKKKLIELNLELAGICE